MNDLEAHFWTLCEQATALEAGSLEARASERPMVEIIALVERNPKHHETFVRCFFDLVLWRRKGPFNLVPFCMRRLRFAEIPELIAREAAEHQGTSYYVSHMNHWSAINHAYLDDVWECANMYDFYAHEHKDDTGKR